MTPAEIINALEKEGITKYRISKETGIHKTTLTRWENGYCANRSMLKVLTDYYEKVKSKE